MDEIVLIGYFLSLTILFIFGLHGYIMLYYHKKYKGVQHKPKADFQCEDTVTIQLPLYNELYVVERLINAVCDIEYPKDKLEIQVLDDSTDETSAMALRAVSRYRSMGYT